MRKGLVLVLPPPSAPVGCTAPGDAAAPASLSAFFTPGAAFQDRNGDGVVDFVDARIVLAAQPSATEVAAAADVAARLGYETTALNLPLNASRRPQADESGSASASIFIGARSLAQARVTADAIGVGALKAGEGAVAAFTAAGTPAVAVLGGDDEGLTAAAVMLAGHLPNIWDQKGPNADSIAEDVAQFLAAKGVTASSTSVPIVQVRTGGDGVERVVA